MYYLSTSCLLLFFLFFLFHPLPCASSKEKLGWCEPLFHCGNITAGFPFWGGNRHKPCGHPLLELRCNKNITSLNISNHEYKVFHINQTSNTLRLVRADLLGSFCSTTFNTAILPPEIFELSPTYRSLTVLYHCDPKLSYRSSYACPDLGLFSISQTLDYQYSCKDSFTINVPTSFVPEEKRLSLTHLESALRKGFEVKLVIDKIPCQECLSSHGICGFNSTTQVCCNVTSQSGAVSCVPQHQPSVAELHRRCSERFSCGNQGDLYYPFWIPGREDCGHPDFKLDCSGGYAQLNIASVKYIVLYMNYNSGTIRLARLDYMGDLCHQNSINAPFTESVLSFTEDTELLTLYYECQFYLSAISATSYVRELGCDSGRSYYVTRNLSSPLLDGSRGLLNNLKGMCKRNVSVPVSGPALNTLQRSPNPDNLKKALEKGFQLGFNKACSSCINSGGACGYNQTSDSFFCYCNGGSEFTHICSSSLDKKYMGSFVQDQLSFYADYLFNGSTAVLLAILIGSCSLAGVIALLVLFCPCCGVRISRKRKTSDDRRQEKLKALIPLKHYTYAQVKKITKSFAEVVGKGGFGVVYKGTLSDGRMVAVKVLKDSNGNGEDFINEVASMSQTSHVNIVSLLGFCSEGSKRAIIYEFLGNGSLDKFISDKNSMTMDLMTLYGIALGVARGLEYLHYGCKTRIVHFDIKPQNVLVDDNLCPKVSDFGLAKLCEKKESIMSLMDMRGTVGYIAPEMISRVYGSVSHKSDVYSYGMLVLEMIGARNKERAHQDSASNTSSIYFPEWVYRDLELENSRMLMENGIRNEEDEIAKKMTLVGLWCIQSYPLDRPPMNRVVEMMEGSLESLQVPPRPVLQKIPAAQLSESFWISGESSNVSDVLICSTN